MQPRPGCARPPRGRVRRSSCWCGVVPRGSFFLFRRELIMMSRFAAPVVRFLKREDGPTAVEYAVMLALIIVVCIGAITTLGNNAKSTFTSVGNTLGATAS